ncbi:GH92 family glycosyl hydrolase [Gandjariella thermophila]|uniref:GH92 family glycosyl hydrolase n=1 Tax=Gandjariella thermophila TaxID=1931992 RepID=UPI001CEF9E1E|nr:GH92 family glycosyl hydrolase [Gandjariella thermophila]
MSRLAVTLGATLALALAPLTTATAQPGAAAPAAQDLARWVNPYIGTKPGDADMGTGGGAANTFPGADVPFGMVQWSPDTVTFQHGGYYYDDNRIRGFSLTHLSGAGCSTYEDIPFIPLVGEVTTSPAADPSRYVSTFSHANEKVTAGYYGVTLDSGAKVELTTTQRTGSGRFSYPAGKPATLLVNTSGSIAGTDDSQITIGRDSISGWAASGHFCGAGDHYRVYFYAQFDRPFASIGTWKNGAVTPGSATERGGAPAHAKLSTSDTATPSARPRSRSVAPQDTTVSGPGSGGYVTFDTSKSQAVNVRVGLSFVSVDGARTNLRAENNGSRSLDQIAAAARAAWNDRLNEVQVTGGSTDERTIFYTALYHALLQPNVFSDADGRYTGFDGRVHTADSGHAMYTNFSGWDIYRSEAQLLATLAPKETSDIARSMIAYAEQGGSWDRWTVANDYTGVMNGDPYHIIVSTAYAFGAKDFDAGRALLSMVRGATQPTQGYEERPGLADYQKLGYVPGAAADTLEYTSADFAIAQLARRLGDGATYDTFMKRAQYWQNLFNPATGYLQPRNADGSFAAPFDPASSSGYVEGNGAQYTWMVPYNLGGLVTALGGKAAANQRLDTFFTKLNAGTRQPYAFLGNEPTLQTPYIYDYTGAPYKTQAITRRVMGEIWKAAPNGLVGNDDLGEMSSWYVWTAMGMYPEIPGRAEFTLTAPLFSKVVLTRPTGQKITINAPGAATAVPYVTGLTVNGQPSTRPWLPESFVNTGGTLDYTLSATPDTTWGSAAADAPPSFADGAINALGYVDPARVVAPAGGSATATIGAQDFSGQGGTVHWTAQPPAGLTVTPSSGDIPVPAGGKAGQPVTVAVAAGTAEATYRIPITYTQDSGAVPGTTLAVLVAQPGSLRAALNNVGTSPDNDQSVANLDSDGYSFSRDALAAAGVRPGGTVTVDGVTHTWPNVSVGEYDNVDANGQSVDLPSAPAGATKLALLGTGTNGNASGTLTITYTDGSTQTADVGFSDWALGGAANNPVSFDNRIVATMPYRNSVSGTAQRLTVYLFATAPITLQPGKQVRSVTLPSNVKGGALHVFSIAVG